MIQSRMRWKCQKLFFTGPSDRACTISLILTLLSCECLVTIQKFQQSPLMCTLTVVLSTATRVLMQTAVFGAVSQEMK